MTTLQTEIADPAPTQELFLEQWQVYRKMVDNDYLFHRGAYGRLHDYLRNELTGPFRFLEVACGDASMSAEALKGTRISDYCGIDISRQALDIARGNLARLPCSVTLEERDLRETDSAEEVSDKIFAAHATSLADTRKLLSTEALNKAVAILRGADRIEVYGIGSICSQ